MARRLGDPLLLTMALGGRSRQSLSFWHDGLDERLRIGAELLTLPGKPVTTEALAHVMLMAASSGGADFAAADQHARQAARIADRYDLPTVAAAVSIYRATRAALDGDSAAAAELYQQAAAQYGRVGQHGAGLAILGRSSLLIMQDRTAEITSELDGDPRMPALFPELYALALSAAGRAADARAVATPLRPLRRDRLWLFLTGIRALLAIALDDRERAESAYQALLPFAARPAGADTMLITSGPWRRSSATSPATSASPARKPTTSTRSPSPSSARGAVARGRQQAPGFAAASTCRGIGEARPEAPPTSVRLRDRSVSSGAARAPTATARRQCRSAARRALSMTI